MPQRNGRGAVRSLEGKRCCRKVVFAMAGNANTLSLRHSKPMPDASRSQAMMPGPE